MTIYDVWINVIEAVWDAAAPAEDAPKERWHALYRSAYRVSPTRVDVVGRKGDIDALMAQLPGATLSGEWIQGRGQPEVNNDPATVLAAQPDIIEYDEDGNQTGTRTPTINDQNEAHRFLGQTKRRAARAFSKGFGRGFS